MIPDPILASMTSSLITFIPKLVAEEISKHRVVKEHVSRLKKNYERVVLMIKSAEHKVKLDDEVARYWLKRAKDHMYEIDNVIDKWIIKNEKRRHRDAECELGSLKRPLSCCIDHCDLNKFAAAIKNLNVDFESILNLPTETNTDQQAIRSYGKTAPDYNAEVIGDYVKSDADNIIKLLHDSMSNCRLVAIVGMVGIGKTTLARMIYHRVNAGTGNGQHFDIKLWMRFSNDLSSLIIWSDCRKEGPIKAQLQQLGAEIANKKFLLVVDSIWTENVWEALLEGPLQQGNRDSRVIVTTRNKHVAKRIGAGHIHYVKRMNNIDAWRLLFRRASLSQNDEVDLKDVGEEIVEKCYGLPLAIRSIGRTLRGLEPTRHDWENVCRTAFQDLSPEEQYIINLSFQDLSWHKKQCFLYCSIFPEGFFIEKQYIIQQWISEGFIVPKRNYTLEEIAEYVFDELIGRGLLHLEFGNDGVTGAKMPLIIRSFAKDVSDYENFCNESVSTVNLFEPRRLSIVQNNEADNHNEDEDSENGGNSGEINIEGSTNNRMANNHRNNNESANLDNLRSMRYLRTLVLHKSAIQDGNVVQKFKELNLLRVLDLREVKGIKALPNAIGSLEHLRYLNISRTEISKVPASVGRLRMLQYLLLRNCTLIETLPKGIGRLRNLRCLDISGTGIREISWSFSGMEELISMQGFPMRNNSLLRSLDLKFPKKLTTLRIDKLENVLVLPSETELSVKEYQLKELELCYNINADPALVPDGRINNITDVIKRFEPHERLVHLKIDKYYGKQYPSWILKLSNLQRLNLQKCVWCEELPSLGELPQLKFLAVTGFDRLSLIGKEFRGHSQVNEVAFPRLQQLFIGDMEALHTWSDIQSQDLPRLQILRLLGCIKLTAVPLFLQKSTTLTRLEVDTRTKIWIENKLQGFAEGTVVNVDNKWQPWERSNIVTPNAQQPSQQDETAEVAVAPQTDGSSNIGRLSICAYCMRRAFSALTQILIPFHFDRRNAALFMFFALSLCLIPVISVYWNISRYGRFLSSKDIYGRLELP